MINKPNILFVHAGAEMYGADRILLELLSGLRENDFKVHVVLPNNGPLVEELIKMDIKPQIQNLGVLRRKYFNFYGLINRTWHLALAVIMLIKFIKNNHISIVHSNTTAVLAGSIAAKISRIPHVWHVHEITTKPKWFVKTISNLIVFLSNKVVFVSYATMSHMTSLNPQLNAVGVVIHNGIDDARVTNGNRGVIRSLCGWSFDDYVIGMVGRINWWKGQSILMDCAEILAPQMPNLKFLFVGGTFAGEEGLRDLLIERVKLSNFAEQIKILDYREDVNNILADLDVFVLPSTEPDPFPTVVLEAMSTSLPIVAFRHGGVCEMVVDGESGILCSPCSSEEMITAIRNLEGIRSKGMKMGHEGLNRIRSNFTKEVFLHKFVNLYVSLT